MNFDFLPFKLNTDLSYFKKLIQYISSDNGVELFKADEALRKPVLGIPVSTVNLYFFEGNLITVYIHLEENPESIELVNTTLVQSITRPGKALKPDLWNGYYWKAENSTLALLQDMVKGKLSLYFSLNDFSVL